MNSVMPSQHLFSQVPQAEIQRSSFDRSHGYKTTFDSGYLVPIFWDEVLPGDSFNLSLTALARLSPTALQRPIMDNLYLDTFFFFVPNRLIWSNWQKFNGEQANPGDSTSFSVPQVVTPNHGAGGVVSNTLFDYLGAPVGPLDAANAGIPMNALHSRAYNLIWNEWFRDQNMQNSVTVDKGDGPDTYSNYVLLRRGKRHDYFTSCLPWPQKGTAVPLPLGSSAPIVTSAATQVTGIRDPLRWQSADNTAPASGRAMSNDVVSASGSTVGPMISASNLVGTGAGLYPQNLYADLSAAIGSTVNSLRQSFQLQKLYERDARGGTRYTEILRAHFGVVSPDARLQRPEYLGGGSTPVNINPVPGTNQLGSTTTSPAQLSAYGTAHASGHGFSKAFVEHGVVLGLASVRADLTYQQGLPRMYSRRTRFDFYWPALAHIGEQSVLNQEIYCQGTSNDALVFGYQERFAEYRYKPSVITGLFRSNVSTGATSIDVWHLSQNFGSLPTLSDTFIKETPPVDRVIAVTGQPQFLYDSYVKLICARPMPVYGVPGLIDHF